MRVETKTFDITDISSGDMYFIARAYYDEAKKDFDGGYKALALQEYEKAKMLFQAYGEKYMVARCEDEIDNINASMEN